MAEKIPRTSSGRRHLRWAGRILSNAVAHQKYNYLLTPAQQTALADETTKLAVLVTALDAAVTPYRVFVETAYIENHAAQTVTDYLCDEAQRNASAVLTPRRKNVDEALKPMGGFAAIFSNAPLSRVLRAGRVATEKMARTAATLINGIPVAIVPTKDAVAATLLKAADAFKGFLDDEENVIDPQRTPLHLAVNTAVYNLREGLEQMEGRLRTNFSAEFIDSLYPELAKGGKTVAEEEDEDAETPDATPATAAKPAVATPPASPSALPPDSSG